MPKKSAGLLLFRIGGGRPEVLLVHPGGPYWRKKDKGIWSIPKGEIDEGESPLEAAKREFYEETGCDWLDHPVPLTPLQQPSGKLIYAWAVKGDCDAEAVKGNNFTLEWPPKSGKQAEFPEIDRAGWFAFPAAREKILPGQRDFIDQLEKILDGDPGSGPGLRDPESVALPLD